MKVIVKGFPKYFYVNGTTGKSTKSPIVAHLWFHDDGDDVTVCSNLTGEVLNEWKHVDPIGKPSVKEVLKVAARYNARGITMFGGYERLGFFIPLINGVECCEDLKAAGISPYCNGMLYDSDLNRVEFITRNVRLFVEIDIGLSELV